MPEGCIRIPGGTDELAVLRSVPEVVFDAADGELAAAHCPDQIGFGSPPRLRDVAEPIGLEFGYALHVSGRKRQSQFG